MLQRSVNDVSLDTNMEPTGHNKSAHIDDCSSGSGSVMRADDIQEQRR